MTTPTAKALDPEQAFALAMGQAGERVEKTTAGTSLRIRIKEHNLIRRRKISVPELGPMTTVQEVAMDSRMSGRFLTSTFPFSLTPASNHPGTASAPRTVHQCAGTLLETV